MSTATIPQELLFVLRDRADRYWTAADIWKCLSEQFPDTADDYTHLLRDADDSIADEPGFVAAQLRQLADRVDRQWLHTAAPAGGTRPSSTRRVEIFRYRGDYDRSL